MTATRRISKIIKDGVEYNIVGGGSEAVDTQLDPDSENPVQNKVIYNAVQGKLDAPAAAGSTGQFVRKGADGNEWATGDLASVDTTSGLELTVGNQTITNATENSDGFMSAFDKKKIQCINHLEEGALVGELYQLTDTLFKQSTPALSDCSVEANVGNSAANTQVHIQRLGSGVADDTLKLKIKKVGSPGDLSVQVMEGVQVTVTANVEAYWYGDSNNVLATGTISASDITTSWQEITVSLNNSVGGTEGQLLDIVLSQASVNASNYYVIACDSTQWSEGFGYVSVNGNTRSRSKLMPYCISDGFAQYMLVKVSDSTITGLNANTYNFSGSKGATKDNDDKCTVTFSDFVTGSASITATDISYTIDTGTYYFPQSTTGILTTEFGSFINKGRFTFTKNSLTIPANTTLTVYANMANHKMGQYYSSFKVVALSFNYKGNITIPKGEYNLSLYPRESKSLGLYVMNTIFGVHVDGSWITQE